MMRRASSASSGVHRDAHLAELVDGQREDGVRHVARTRPTARRAPRAGRGRCCASTSDCVRKMTTRSFTTDHLGDLHAASAARGSPIRGVGRSAARRPSAGSSSCRRAAARRRRTPRSRAARARAARRTAGARAPRRCGRAAASPKQSSPRVHRLADAVGEEHVQVAGVQRNRLLLEQPLEHLAVVDLQAEHQAVGRQHAATARSAHAGRPGTIHAAACGRRARRSSCARRRSTTA